MSANSASAPTSILSRIFSNSDIVLAVAVVAIVAMMVIPLPPMLLDMLITLNIAMAVTIVLVSLYMQQPLDFSVFPSLLLILTLFRLGLNISSTRLILLTANAGNVITAFGNFVVGGNYVVGIVVFLILMVIQFIVITNGAGRVAEVAARFTLDAMPGKQMSIDADLNAGLITEEDARARRKAIEQEADFYGAMDGASKFVKGDAIAGIVIVIVNILGGFVIGVLQLNMSLLDSLQIYTLLTVGDGLVSQIPALLISTATGIIVTRTAAEENMGSDVMKQITSNHRALLIVSALLFGFALVPGLPKVPFIVMGALSGMAGYFLRQEKSESDEAKQLDAEAAKATAPALAEPEAVTTLLQVDPLEVEIGYGLISMVDTGTNSSLLNRITMIRRQVATELGFILPKIRVRDNLQLRPNAYAIKLRGEQIAVGDLMPGHFLAMAAGPVSAEVSGVPTVEPAFGLPAVWVDSTKKERAETMGYTVVDPASVLSTHLTEVIKKHADEILSRQATRDLLDNLKEANPALIDGLVPGQISLSEVQEVLKNLLNERVSIRDLVTILETVSNLAANNIKDTDLLSEASRQALARSITNQYRSDDGALHLLTLSPRVEGVLAEAMSEQGLRLNLNPQIAQRLMELTSGQMEAMASKGYMPIVLCSATVRLAFRRLVERALPNLVVLSYSEIASGVDVRAEGMVELPANE